MIVLVPELEALLREATTKPGLIGAMLSRGRVRQLDPEAPHAQLATGAPAAPAALTRRLDAPDDADGCWMRADPIELTPDLSAVWMRAGVRLEHQPALSELVERFSEEGGTLDFPVPERGYLRLERIPDCRFAPPWALAGTSMEHVLPRGPDERRWRRLLNETQMMLHQHRQTAGAGPPRVPGSLWFWGAGRLPSAASVRPRVRNIISSDPVLAGLADWLGLAYSKRVTNAVPEPGTLVEWPGEHGRSADDNLEALQQFLRPAWRRLRSGRLQRLELASLGHSRAYGRADAWRVWR